MFFTDFQGLPFLLLPFLLVVIQTKPSMAWSNADSKLRDQRTLATVAYIRQNEVYIGAMECWWVLTED